MIRTITLLSLVLAASSVFAEGLYKWVEADGSITFSPNRPPDGVEFERIGADNDSPKSMSAAPDTKEIPAKRAAEQSAASSNGASTGVTTESTPKRLNYAPGHGNKPSGITRSEPRVAAASEAGETSETGESASKGDSDATTITVAASKQRRCEDLKKRVVSLERRLKVRLSPADMDNTVVHMARYQKSYNQHCLR